MTDLENVSNNYLEITPENIKEYYINKNYRINELKAIFGCSLKKLYKIMHDNNIQKPKELKNKNREDYCLKKYGVRFNSNVKEVIEKTKSTMLKKYGSTSYFSSDIGKSVIKNKWKEYFGVDNPSQISKDKEITDIINNGDKLKNYIIENNIKTGEQLAKILNYTPANIIRKINKYGLEYLLDRSQSVPEVDIKNYINQHYKTENNTKKYLDGKEIDIYIPELKIGIEFNGNYWHSEIKKNKIYHQQKSLLAESKGIFLYHIFEYEWDKSKDRIVSQLNNILGINQIKIYARKCVIKEVSNSEKDTFLEKNHLQGCDKSSIKLGLYYNNELVSIMTFTKPRFNKKYKWELSRFCSKAGTNVIGGASKLFKYFITNYKPENIISYSNIAHTRGRIYNLLGFKLDHISEPNYVWCKGNSILSRYKCQKHKLLENGYNGYSESTIMHNNKYFKIFDCGNKVWIWKNNS